MQQFILGLKFAHSGLIVIFLYSSESIINCTFDYIFVKNYTFYVCVTVWTISAVFCMIIDCERVCVYNMLGWLQLVS